MSKKLMIIEITDQEYSNLLDNIARKSAGADSTVAIAAAAGIGATTVENTENGSAPVVVTGEALRDDRGVVWHGDFHASTKTKKGDGSWTKRKGVSNDAINAYEAQFLNGAAVAAPAMTVSVPPVPASVVIPATPVPAMPGLPGAAPVLPMPAAVIPPAPVDYQEIVTAYGALMTAGKIGNAPGQYPIETLYAGAGIDPQQLQTEETARAALMAKFVEIGYTRA